MKSVSDIKSKIRDRMQDTGSGGLVDVAKAEWDLSEYNNFFSDCREAGHSATECGNTWSELKDRGELPGTEEVLPDDAPTPDAPSQTSTPDTGEDVVVLMEDTDASNRVATMLAEPVVNGDVEAVTVKSDRGQEILQDLPDGIAVPCHAVRNGDGFEHGDLKELLGKHVI